MFPDLTQAPNFEPWVGPPRLPLLPDRLGFFGVKEKFGGRYVPEILAPNLEHLDGMFRSIVSDQTFWSEFLHELHGFSGRPTPITHCANLSRVLGGAQIFLKREDLSQTGAHKINNVIGQGLLVRRMGKKRVIAETGAGQHGVATATMAARFGFEAVIYMGAEDVERQRPNVFWMEKMGAKVVPVHQGTATLKDAINEALRDWSGNVDSTHYLLGTACGPDPFPALVSYLQSVVGLEARQQMEKQWGRIPNRVYACVGGGSNALGIFQGFIKGRSGSSSSSSESLIAECKLIGVEAGGVGVGPGKHAARVAGGGGKVGIAQGYKTLFLQNRDGQMQDTYSVAAGLDYVGISPILAAWSQDGIVEVQRASDAEVLAAAKLLMEHEGIIPALESSHGLAAALRDASSLAKDQALLVNLSGRGDKDIFTFADALGDHSWADFLVSRGAKGRRQKKTRPKARSVPFLKRKSRNA